MAFTIKPPDIASKSSTKYQILFIYMMCPIVVGSPLVITGVSHHDVLLPCHGSYHSEFRFYVLVVNWQRTENDHVVHSFFDGTDQPQYQEKEFKGRTQLFPEEFQKGNASLLLKNLRASDAGRYTCHCILDDFQVLNPQYIELQVLEVEMYNSDKENNILLYVFIPVGLLLLIICAIILVIRKKRRKAKQEVDITSQGLKEVEHTKKGTVSSESGVCLQSQENVDITSQGLEEAEHTKKGTVSSESGVCLQSQENVDITSQRLEEAELTKKGTVSSESGVCLQSQENAKTEAYMEKSPDHQLNLSRINISGEKKVLSLYI